MEILNRANRTNKQTIPLPPQLWLMILLFLCFLTLVSTSKIDLGAGEFLKTFCAPNHPNFIGRKSEFVCTLKEQDFYPNAILNTVLGLDILSIGDMVIDLNLVMSINILKLKRETKNEFETYKTEIGSDSLVGLVTKLINIGRDHEYYDLIFALYEEFELETWVLANRATPDKLIQRMALVKPELTATFIEKRLYYPPEYLMAALHASNDEPFDAFMKIVNARKSNLSSVLAEYGTGICQKHDFQDVSRVRRNIGRLVKYFTDHAAEKEAKIIKAIDEICYGKDESRSFALFQKFDKTSSLILKSARKSNHIPTTVAVLKFVGKDQFLNVFPQNQVEIVLKLVDGLFDYEFKISDYSDLMKTIIQEGLQSDLPGSVDVVIEALKHLESSSNRVEISLYQKGLKKIQENPELKSSILDNLQKLKIILGYTSTADLIKRDELNEFIKYFGGEIEFFEFFEIPQPERILVFLNRDEDFDSAFKLIKLQNRDLIESDFFADSLSKSLHTFPDVHYSGILGEQYSIVFLTVRRAQVEHLIKRFGDEILEKLPQVFVKVLKEL